MNINLSDNDHHCYFPRQKQPSNDCPAFVTPHTANTLKLRRWFITLSAMFTDLHVYMKVTVNGKDRKYFRSI